MAYQGSGRMPMERASKIGHIKMIQDPHLQRMMAEFESSSPTSGDPIGERSGHIDLTHPSNVQYVIAVDGGEAIIPNQIRREKRAGLISVAALLLQMNDLEEMKNYPILDPRDLARRLKDSIWFNTTFLPMAGIRIPGQSVKESIRRAVDSTFHFTGLYPTLQFLVSREWDSNFIMSSGDAPYFFCRQCGGKLYVPKSTLHFRCPHCNHPHTLSDYLGIGEESAEEWTREETVKALRNTLETLTVFHFLRVWRTQPETLSQILFVKDGPLMLRAGLYRLVDSIRAFIAHLQEQRISFYLIGIEKTGEMVNHLDEIKNQLPEPGDFFLPTVPYIIEQIDGYAFNPHTYRNRVQYGAKVAVRLGPNHILPLNIPTPEFLLYPTTDDLIGFQESVTTLSRLISYRYENAIIPIVLANEHASISQRPSGDILESYINSLIVANTR